LQSRATVKARVTERLDRDQAEHQAKIEAWEAKIEAAGKTRWQAAAAGGSDQSTTLWRSVRIAFRIV
jgi:hypothetical protein